MPALANSPEKAAEAQDLYRIEAPYYPIVYVRGYAMSSGERDETFHDGYYGYYGFAATSVRKRQGPPDPDRYLVPDVFEGQLMRLVKDFGYADAINRDNRIERPPRQAVCNPSRGLWVSRFYDADVLGQRPRGIEDHAQELLTLIRDVIPAELKECGMDPGDIKKNYRVVLLAHSMGGLVCRTGPQNLLPAAGIVPADLVHRFVTMGTPHGGIEMGSLPRGLQQWVMNTFNPDDASIFGKQRLRQYLKIPAGHGVNTKMHWRAQDPCENAIRVDRARLEGRCVALHTAFLHTAPRPALPAPADPAGAETVPITATTTRQVPRYLYFRLALRVGEHRVREAGGLLADCKHLVGIDADYDGNPVYSEALEIRVEAKTYDVEYRWFSDADTAAGVPWKRADTKTPVAGGFDYRFPLRAEGALRGDVVIHAQKWQPEVWAKAG